MSLQVRIGRLFEQLCQALGYLHAQGWVHRDVKPDNILFNKSSELRLIDFSLTTRAAGAMSQLISGKGKVIQGTRTYISPETILKAPPSPQADIYSLGVTLFEVLAGEPPFRGTSPDDLLKKHLTSAAPPPSAFNDNVTPEMDRFVLKMLAKKTKDRYKNTSEMLAEFRNIKPFKEDAAERDRRVKKEEEVALPEHARQIGSLGQPGRPSQATALERQPRFRQGRGRKEKSDCQAGADPERGKSRTRQAGGCGGPRRVAPFAEGCAPPTAPASTNATISAGATVTPGRMPAPASQAGYPARSRA